MWTRAVARGATNRRTRLKATRKGSEKSSKRKSSLSMKELTSGSGESAVVHFVQPDLASSSDGVGESDDDPAVERTMKILSVVGCDDPASTQEKEVRSSGGIPSQ